MSVATSAPSSRNSTFAIPLASAADAWTVTVPRTSAPAAGAVIDVEGSPVSITTVTETGDVVAKLPQAS